MTHSLNSSEIVEIQSHLSSIQDSVDHSLQGLGSRNGLLFSGSQKYFMIASDLKERLSVLHKYSSSLSAKHKNINLEIHNFNQNLKQNLLELKSLKTDEKQQLFSREQKLTEIHEFISNNNNNKINLTHMIESSEKEIEALDKKCTEIENILMKPIVKNNNEKELDEINGTKIEIKFLMEKIDLNKKQIMNYQNTHKILQPVSEIAKKLFILRKSFTMYNEEEHVLSHKIKSVKSTSKKIINELQQYNDQIVLIDENTKKVQKEIIDIKTTSIKIKNEKENKEKSLKEISKIEDDLRIINQEYELEVKNEIEMSHIAQTMYDLEKNKDPENSKIEQKIKELQNDYTLISQKVDDASIIETKLLQKIDELDQITMLEKEKIQKEIYESVAFREQKLFGSLRENRLSIENTKDKITQLQMILNVLEAEKNRLTKKIHISEHKLKKYKEKIKNKHHHSKKHLSHISQENETIEFKISQISFILQHKKENIQVKKASIDQMQIRLFQPCNKNFCSGKILAPIVPYLSQRETTAQILCKTAQCAKNAFNIQKKEWSSISSDAIQPTLERWEDTIDMINPSIEKKLLCAKVALAC